MNLSEELQWRGFVNQTTFSDLSKLDEEKRTFYWGVDPSGKSMQVGNLAAAMMAKIFINHGWKAILLVGGATGMVGDPDGKKDERDLQTIDKINENKKAIAEEYKTVFDGQDFILVDNYDWFSNINYLEFLRTVGKHVSLTQMLDKSFIQDRIGEGGSGISYAEFSYALIQGYDYLHLNQQHGATVQLAGADQWGNSIAGVDLIRRIEGVEAHVYTCPLILDSSGKKFGKSEGNAVWVSAELTSTYKYFQFWLNAGDSTVGGYIKQYTSITSEEFDKIMAEFEKNPQGRSAQKYLAYEATKQVRGEVAANSARKVTQVLFGDNKFDDLDESDLEMLSKEIPTTKLNKSVVDILVDTEVCSSKGEARRLIEGNAVSINGSKITDSAEYTVEKSCLIKKGKNTFILAN